MNKNIIGRFRDSFLKNTSYFYLNICGRYSIVDEIVNCKSLKKKSSSLKV